MKGFLGLSGYIWWVGVVESRQDPLKLGRCQVRIHGWHSEDKGLIPTEDLVWAHGAYPIDSSSPTPPREGTMVQGYFLDGESGQFPVITHVIPGIPEILPPIDKGFSDQRKDEQLTSSPREPKKVTYNTDGTGVEIEEKDKAERYPDRLNEPTTSRLARNEKIDETLVQRKKDSTVTGTETAKGSTWDEPKTKYATVYPYNRVVETESGHVLEFDDTPGAERVHVAHRSGSFIEFHPSGDVVIKDTKNKYEIVMADDKLLIMGKSDITVNGDASLLVKGDNTIKIKGDNTITVEGDNTVTINGDSSFTVKGDGTFKVDGDLTATVEGDASATIQGQLTASISGSVDISSESSIVVSTPSTIHLLASKVHVN